MEQSSKDQSSLVLYRAFDHHYTTGMLVNFSHYPVIRQTPKTYIINVYGEEKRVLKDQNKYTKRFAYVSKEDAIYDLKIRREKELQHLVNRHDKVAETLEFLKTYEIPKEIHPHQFKYL
jgi:hypothetical protein